MPQSRALLGLGAVIIIIIVGFATYAGLTYPKTVLFFPVSFTIGADVTNSEFEQPTLNNRVQVQVSVENGAALWQARILSSDQVIWEHASAQGEQTSYNSEWIELPSGHYNFTFGTIGVGSLNALVTVSSKGGFW